MTTEWERLDEIRARHLKHVEDEERYGVRFEEEKCEETMNQAKITGVETNKEDSK